MKVCCRSDVGDERYERELRGVKLYGAIPSQEGLVRMREFAEEPWGFYAVMDLADDEFGGERITSAEYRPKTLARVIEGEKALPLRECVKLGVVLAKGLATLQRHHLLHRDIKPGNVIFVGGCPVLSDPGLLVEESEATSRVGTPGYAPPENFTAAAGDIYSLGLTLKAASFGRRIEDLDKGPALEADTGAKLFPAWWRILNKATDPTSSRRYQSAKALLKDLESLRRKMSVSSVARSYVAKVAIALVSIGIVTIVALSIIGSRRAKDEVARQSAESKSLKDDLARQSAENQSLKDDLARQSAESKSLKDDLARQSAESESLRDDLAKQSAESKSLKENLARQAAESRSLKDDLAKQSAEIKLLKDDLIKQPEENKALKATLARQSAEIKSLKDDLVKQSVENLSLKYDLARQPEENKALKETLARQSAEIEALKDNLAKQSAGKIVQHDNITVQSAEIEELKKFKADTEELVARTERETLWPIFFLTFNQFDYEDMFKDRIDDVAKTNQVCAAKMRYLLDRMLELDWKDKALAEKARAMYNTGQEKIKRGLDDKEDYFQAKKIHSERIKLHDEITSIFKELQGK